MTKSNQIIIASYYKDEESWVLLARENEGIDISWIPSSKISDPSILNDYFGNDDQINYSDQGILVQPEVIEPEITYLPKVPTLKPKKHFLPTLQSVGTNFGKTLIIIPKSIVSVNLQDQMAQVLTFDNKEIKMSLFEVNGVAPELLAIYFSQQSQLPEKDRPK